MSKNVHYRTGIGPHCYACGIGTRWSSQNITSTASLEAVTCGNCIRTEAFAKGVQDHLNENEHDCITKLAQVANLLAWIVGEGVTREKDLNELLGHVHTLQSAVLSQAARRLYPEKYRMLGEVHGQ